MAQEKTCVVRLEHEALILVQKFSAHPLGPSFELRTRWGPRCVSDHWCGHSTRDWLCLQAGRPGEEKLRADISRCGRGCVRGRFQSRRVISGILWGSLWRGCPHCTRLGAVGFSLQSCQPLRPLTKNKYLLIKADLFLLDFFFFFYSCTITFSTFEFSEYFVNNAYNSSKSINYKLPWFQQENWFSHLHVFLELSEQTEKKKEFALKRRMKRILGKRIYNILKTKLKKRKKKKKLISLKGGQRPQTARTSQNFPPAWASLADTGLQQACGCRCFTASGRERN